MPKVKKLAPHVAAITAVQIAAQVIGSVKALNDFAKLYPDQCIAARTLFKGEQHRALVCLANSHLTDGTL